MDINFVNIRSSITNDLIIIFILYIIVIILYYINYYTVFGITLSAKASPP